MNEEQRRALVELAQDLSRGDSKLVAAVKAAIESPPRTTEEVGYYVSGKENAFENCFRKLASLLSETEYATSAEDKYVYEIFEQWAERLCELPEEFQLLFPQHFLNVAFPSAKSEPELREALRTTLRDGYTDGVMSLEEAFADVLSPLLCVDTGGGDTILFVNVTPAAAHRWRDTKIGEDHLGIPLGIRSPMWDAFWSHLDYALRLDLGDPPADLRRPKPLRGLTEVTGFGRSI